MMSDFNLHNWIIIIIFAVIFGYCVISNKRYERLEEQYQELLLKDNDTVDSLIENNVEKELIIKNLESEIVSLNHNIDSLQKIKSNLYKDKDKENFIISQSISESVLLLKKNLYEMNN